MNCPACKNAMIILELEQVETDYCCNCGGIWLDAGELELLFDNSRHAAQLINKFDSAHSFKENIHRCPICHGKMDKIFTCEHKSVIIDRCPKSHGLWFDRGELAEVLREGSFDKEKKVIKLLTEMFGVNKMAIEKGCFGKFNKNTDVESFILKNKNGIEAKVITLGATLVSLNVPDKDGKLTDIVLGYDNSDGYLKDSFYLGCTVGRCAIRIANASFTLDGKQYKLAANNGTNHLHGGIVGFNKVLWKAKSFENTSECGVDFEYLSPDGEEGYPGNLKTIVRYTLTNDNELKISYEATTDKTTIVNLTNHSYFNLAGHNAADILSHKIKINADKFTTANELLLPTGEFCAVKGTPFDFTQETAIGKNISQTGIGYDLNYVINKKMEGETAFAAKITDPSSGRVMEIFTTEPGIQFYTGNFLDGSKGKAGTGYKKHSGFCLETQHYPNSPNQPKFPSTALLPGKVYKHLVIHKFSTI